MQTADSIKTNLNDVLLHLDMKFLNLQDKISLLFLLCDDSEKTLLKMKQLIKEHKWPSGDNLFKAFLIHEQAENVSFMEKFVEAAGIIQNFRLLSRLGISKEKVLKEHLPHILATSSIVDRTKKILYKLCEELNTENTLRFIKLVEEKELVECNYLEVKLLQWCCDGLITIQPSDGVQLDKVLKILKVFDLESIKHELESVIKEKNSTKPVKNLMPVVNCNYYEILDENILGHCIIVNEKHFYKSSDEKYAPLLPEINFESRTGTDKDVEHLEEIFAALGFQVTTYNDLDFNLFLELLDHYSQNIPLNHSMFILIVLSHGSENVIYTCDSVPVNVESIELKFQGQNCPNLINKPKIFIIQSCQGPDWQQTVQTDSSKSINRQIGPERGDALIAWSTVKGFASFRDKYSGSWFIQELCKELWNRECDDFVDILLQVNKKLRGKSFEGQIMIPWVSLTLCKKVKLPMTKCRKEAATKLMLERLLFEECFSNMLDEISENDLVNNFNNVEM